jgi:hypothetical protein
MLGAFAITVVILAINGGPPSESPLGIAATVAVLVAAYLGVRPGPYPMPVPRASAIVALTAFCNLAITLQLPADRWPGWSSWNFGITAIALMTLSLRGRIVAGWIGLALMTAIAVGWSWAVGGSPRLGFDLVYTHLGINLAITFFAVGLRRAVVRIAALREVESRRAAELAAREASDMERLAELRRLSDDVVPALRRIAEGRLSEQPEAMGFRLLEARLRDRIRARKLDQPSFRAAVDRARTRGVDVLLLDDVANELDHGELGQALEWAASLVDRSKAGSAIVRLAGSVPATLTFVATEPAINELRQIETARAPDSPTRPSATPSPDPAAA